MIKQFIDWAEKQVCANTTITKQRHGDQSDVFKIETAEGNYFLKISPKLEKERERLAWLRGKLPVPEVIGFIKIGSKEALLLSSVEGKNLAELKKEWPVEKVVDKLVNVLKKFHAVDATDCPFGNYKPGSVLVHGDACLPNFIFKEDDFSGYIDLGDMTIGNPEIDFAAAIWSLQYNFGKGYGLSFLRKCGVKNATDELVEESRLKYEDMQKEWGLSS
ncbi:MAG: phosphotransferase [Parcubacteria group bacterium]